jgi:predicted secreted protein/putative hemolysin
MPPRSPHFLPAPARTAADPRDATPANTEKSVKNGRLTSKLFVVKTSFIIPDVLLSRVNTMNRIVVYGIAALAAICLLAAGAWVLFVPATETPLHESETSLANPAAVWCEEMGYSYEIRTDAAGNQYGVCILPDGTERDAWEAYREAHPDGAPPAGTPRLDAQAGYGGMVVLTEAENGGTVAFEAGRVFAVSLEENPSTGYAWRLNATEGLINDSEGFEPSSADGELAGAPGVHTWTFHGDQPGTYLIEGVYARPWEEPTGAEERFTLTVEIV